MSQKSQFILTQGRCWLVVVCILWLAGCAAPEDALVKSNFSGCRFQMVGISDEYARGVQAGMTMCGLFTSTHAERTGADKWEFRGTYRK